MGDKTMKNFVLQFVIIPQLRTWAAYFGARDNNETGRDDIIARALYTTADEIEKYLNELPK